MTGSTSPFREVHRSAAVARVRRIAGIAAAVVAVVLGVWAVPAVATSPAPPSVTAVPAAAPDPTAVVAPPPDPATPPAPPPPASLPAPDRPASPAPPPAPALQPGPRHTTIAVDTRGYQAEIDRCLWVRMDLADAVPIVGAHNYCGGDVVLGLQPGDRVTLMGEALDGDYAVVESRDARAGDDAAQATDGLTATVVLQTCYYDADGLLRLVALVPEGA